MTPTNPSRRAALAAVLMGSSVWVAAQATPSQPLIGRLGRLDLARDVPERFAGWQVDARTAMPIVNPQQQAFIERVYSQTLSRVYFDEEGHQIMLSVAYGEDQRRASALHEPEVCYPAQGFRIARRSQGVVHWGVPRADGALPVSRMETVLNAQRFEPVSYWLVIGQQRVQSTLERKLALYRYGLQGLIADGVLMRVSSLGRDSAAQFSLQDRFIAQLLGVLPPAVRSRLAGQEVFA